MQTQVFNSTFRNVGRSGELGGMFDILTVKPPELTTGFFTSQTPRTTSTTSYQTSSVGTPTFQGSGSGGTLKADNMFNSSVGLISQALSAWGRNPTQQITGSSTVQALIAPAPAGYNGSAGLPQSSPELIAYRAELARRQEEEGAGKTAYKAGTGILDSLAKSFNVSTTTLLLGGAAAALLLFKKPPTRR